MLIHNNKAMKHYFKTQLLIQKQLGYRLSNLEHEE